MENKKAQAEKPEEIEKKNKEDAQRKQMLEEPIPRLVTKLAIPAVAGMVITSIYNMADTFFVSQLGTSAAAAVGIVFSLMALIQAAGYTLGMGAGSIVSRRLGKGNEKQAAETASAAFYASLLIGLAILTAGLAFLEPLMKVLGAASTVLPYSIEYGRYILIAAPVMCASFVLGSLLRSQGKASLAMIGLGIGGLCNTALDPLFIFGLGMGISGAAVATMLSQLISFFILLLFFWKGKGVISIAPQNISRRFSVYWQILKIGFPSFCRQGLASAAAMALNNMAAGYGDQAVAAMSIVGRISVFALSAMIGFGQGFQPVAGYNYGAGKNERVKEALRFCIRIGTIALTGLGILLFIFAPQLIALFRKDDPQVTEIGAFALRAQCLLFPFIPFTTVSNMAFQALGRSWQAVLLSSARQGIFFLPLIFLLPRWFGLWGIEITQAAADALTALLCIPLFIPFYKRLGKNKPSNSDDHRKNKEEPAAGE